MEFNEQLKRHIETGLANYRAKLVNDFGDVHVPSYMWDGIWAHIMEGRPVGDFLTAVFECDFLEICIRADDQNQQCLMDYRKLMYWMPPQAFGSREKVQAWRAGRGMRGEYGRQVEEYEKEVERTAADRSIPDSQVPRIEHPDE